ncbi:FAD binding domain-containing protein [Bradyrhizobium sp. SZCCHNG3015]|uniref:FAD binding domain-containing protein n=1 Tax=unclassified Bradyrhizobium TaxID=2631580 RepID=UPI0039655CE3
MILASARGAARIMAGGQLLGPMPGLRLVQPTRDHRHRGARRTSCGRARRRDLVLGAYVTRADIEDDRIPDATQGILQGIAAGIAYRAVRNRGTIGGSISHADSAADWVTT